MAEERRYTREQIIGAVRLCFQLSATAYVTPAGDVLPIKPSEEEEKEQDEMLSIVLDALYDGVSVEDIKKELFDP